MYCLNLYSLAILDGMCSESRHGGIVMFGFLVSYCLIRFFCLAVGCVGNGYYVHDVFARRTSNLCLRSACIFFFGTRFNLNLFPNFQLHFVPLSNMPVAYCCRPTGS